MKWVYHSSDASMVQLWCRGPGLNRRQLGLQLRPHTSIWVERSPRLSYLGTFWDYFEYSLHLRFLRNIRVILLTGAFKTNFRPWFDFFRLIRSSAGRFSHEHEARDSRRACFLTKINRQKYATVMELEMQKHKLVQSS